MGACGTPEVKYSGLNDLAVGVQQVILYEDQTFYLELGLGGNNGEYKLSYNTVYLIYENKPQDWPDYLIMTDEYFLASIGTGEEPRSLRIMREGAYQVQKENLLPRDSIPPDGVYRFDIAFAEWQGKSMGEKVTVIVKGDSVTVRYEGGGNLTNSSPGDIFDKGKIRKHKSGVFIISNDPTDVDLNEVGGCGDGPTVIDFENKKYWLC
jgi:hypothetical protein